MTSESRTALVPILLVAIALVARAEPARAEGEAGDTGAVQATVQQPSQEKVGDKTVDELIQELEKRGVVVTKPAAKGTDTTAAPAPVSAGEAAPDATRTKLDAIIAWFDRVHLYGDLRSRAEGFIYQTDPLGNDPKDRYRWRYRLRAGIKADINDYFDAAFQLTTGSDNNSENQTLGSGPDFNPDGIFVREAYTTVKPFGAREMPLDMSAQILFGKMPNPFRSKKGAALIVWDGDISPEGIAVSYGLSPVSGVRLDAKFGYYIIDAMTNLGTDPHVLAVQLDSSWQVSDDWQLGFTPTYYDYGNLNQAFFDRGSYAVSGFNSNYGGNVPGGMSDNNTIQTGDFRVWASFTGLSDWPMLVYGNITENFSAQNTSGFGAGKEATAWSAGLQLGDKKKWVQLGAAYFQVEANSTPSNFTDSDLFDGKTNGKGWFLQVVRQIFTNTDLAGQLMLSKPLDKSIFGPTGSPGGPGDPPTQFDSAVKNLDRIRFQLDVIVKW